MVMVSDAQANVIGGTSEVAATPLLRWNHRGRNSIDREVPPVSARKLAASLWRFAAPAGGTVRWQCADRLGFQFCSSMPIPKFANEGAAKAWDLADYVKSASLTLTSGKNVNKGGWSRTKMRKMNEEEASSVVTEWRSVIKNLVECVKNERKFCKKMDKMNSDLLRDIAEAKLSDKKLIRHLEKEKKAREELEDVCYGLAKEIEGRKAEMGALRNEQIRLEEEVEEERKMRQMGEVWREEQAQMKLAHAKFILENKYGKVNEVIANIRAFMRKSIPNDNVPAEADGWCCSNDRADSASILHYISNERNKNMSEDEISWVLAKGESERTVNKMKISYNSKRKVNKGSQKPDNKVSSSSRLQNGSSMSSTVSMASPARMNPHVVRAMTGHNQWPWRIQRVGNILEAKLES